MCPASVPPALSGGPFTRATALRHITPDQLRSGAYRRVAHGVYVAHREISHGDRIEAARLVLPAGAVLRGRSALWASGIEVAGPGDLVEVAVPPARRIRSRALLRVSSESVLPGEVVDTPLGPATSPARTAFDLARLEDPLTSFPLLDALVRATGLAMHAVEAVAAAHARTRWISRVRRALDLVDPGAESLAESRLRVTLVLGGLPRPRTQVKIVTERGEFVARTDLGWTEHLVAVEYDGAYHDDPAQYARDRARLNAMRSAGWTVLVVDRAQLARPELVVEMVRRVLASAAPRGRPVTDRSEAPIGPARRLPGDGTRA